MVCECACQQHARRANQAQRIEDMRTNSVFLAASDTVSPPCTSSQTAVKSRKIRSMIGEQSGNLNTSRYFNKIPEHKVTDIDSTSANARTHARIQHCLRGTVTMATSVEQARRKMTVVVRPRGYTHMAKIDHFEGLFRQLWTRVFAPNKLIWKARNELNPFLQKNRCHLQTANKSNI